MSTNGRYRARTAAVCAALGLLTFCGALQLPALAAEQPVIAAGSASITKGPEVSTVGTGPYIGPLPEEISKLVETQTPSVESSTEEKQPDVATMTTTGGNTLTPAELAKIAALPAVTPVPLALEMPKLELMTVPSDGIPELTAEDLDKRARELAAPTAPVTPAAPQSAVPTSPAPALTPTATPERAR